MFWKNPTVKILNHRIDSSTVPLCSQARLVYINGKGVLKSEGFFTDDENDFGIVNTITLNGQPLVTINSPGCPTCASMVAAGHGIEQSNTPELLEISQRVNADFAGLDQFINGIEPLLSLLPKGLYVIADVLCYPVDGDGRFFWSVPDELTEYSATAGVLLPETDFAYVSGQPVFLYPTQSTGCFQEERVQYYVKRLAETKSPPRAIAYQFGEFISFLLDGHHKACAAALLKRPLPCVTILPFSGYHYQAVEGRTQKDKLLFAGFSVPINEVPPPYAPKERAKLEKRKKPQAAPCGKIGQREWEDAYLQAGKSFPTTWQYANCVAAGVYDCDEETVGKYLQSPYTYGQELKCVLFLLEQQGSARLKQVALDCAMDERSPLFLKEQAFQVLNKMKNDGEVEDFFVRYLVDNEDKKSRLYQIADTYWDQ